MPIGLPKRGFCGKCFATLVVVKRQSAGQILSETAVQIKYEPRLKSIPSSHGCGFRGNVTTGEYKFKVSKSNLKLFALERAR